MVGHYASKDNLFIYLIIKLETVTSLHHEFQIQFFSNLFPILHRSTLKTSKSVTKICSFFFLSNIKQSMQ